MGRGGAGDVYAVTEIASGRRLALKVLNDKASLVEKKRLRFIREALLVGRLDHPGVIKIVHCGVHDGATLYYVMSLMEGETLDNRLARQSPLPLALAIDVALSILEALAYAHSKGVIHRDIKPGNIFLVGQEDGQITACLLDFGLARTTVSEGGESLGLTGSRDVIGTPVYISPEQSLGRTLDARSDLYSFGITFFEMLTGAPPFLGDNLMETLVLHQEAPIPRLAQFNSESRFDPFLEDFVCRLLAKKADERYQSAAEALVDLVAYRRKLRGETSPYDSDAERDMVRVFSRLSLVLGVLALLGSLSILLIFGLDKKAGKSAGRLETGASLASKSLTPSLADEEAHRRQLKQAALAVRPASYARPALTGKGGGRVYLLPEKMPYSPLFVHDANLNVERPLASFNGRYLRVGPAEHLAVAVKADLLAVPQFLLGFDSDVLDSLHFPKGAQNLESFLQTASYFKGLKKLDLQHTEADDGLLSIVDAFTELQYLNVRHTKISAEALSGLKRLSKLQTLELAKMQGDIGLLLNKLQPGVMQMLSLEEMPLDDASLAMVGRLKGLFSLKLINCGIAGRDLHELKPLAPGLFMLDLSGDRIDPSVLSFLDQCKNLKDLKIDVSLWNEAQVAELKQSMVNCPSLRLVGKAGLSN
ncbi:MAG: serine/threonine protein kinase [Candidatus Obscuribacterales bacterium]|nr:serine/threonine protein kinase [Candidatus Obscuribacterales bacterium]